MTAIATRVRVFHNNTGMNDIADRHIDNERGRPCGAFTGFCTKCKDVRQVATFTYTRPSGESNETLMDKVYQDMQNGLEELGITQALPEVIQPEQTRSLSMGDVITLEDSWDAQAFVVASTGFEQVNYADVLNNAERN